MGTEKKLRVCVPICEATIAAARETLARAEKVADIVELRLDCLSPRELSRESELKSLLGGVSVPVIVTLRPREQGGTREFDLALRKYDWLSGTDSSQILRDVELDLANEDPGAFRTAQMDSLICSYHDFSGLQLNAEQIYEQLARTPAGILKLAVQAHDVTDCIPIFQLLDRARSEQRELIGIAMGEAGLATRILGPSRGAFLTYAALDASSANAPGQPTVDELRHQYRIQKINLETQVMGLVGLPVEHSVSPEMHNAAFGSTGMNAVYLPFPVRDLTSFMRRLVNPRTREIDLNIRGLSVTAPHKSAVMSSLDWIEPAAAELGAVNTIVVKGDELHGYNTDGLAFLQVTRESLGDLRNARCAVIGSGGVARAILWSLRQASACTTVFARNQVQSAALAAEFGAGNESLDNASFANFDLVINATPLGTAGAMQEDTPVTAAQLRGARLAFDLVYNPLETRFLREASVAGCQTLGGLPMLVKQALEQFRLWTGIEASEQVMSHAAHKALRSR